MSSIRLLETGPLQDVIRAIEYGSIQQGEAGHPMRRFKIDPGTTIDNTASIRGPDANHMINVLRLEAGATVVLFDGTGWEYTAVIEKISRREVHLAVKESRQCQVESPTRITVAQGFLKDKKMDTIIRQLTELGISRWIPFFGARSVPRPDAKRLANRMTRWQKIADESLKQCRRSCSPRIEAAAGFSEMLRLADGAAVKLVFWEAEASAFPESDRAVQEKDGEVFIVLGPEGGLTPEEIGLARQAGFQPVSLGPRILRAETATVAASALVQYLFGDLGEGQPFLER
jgi:16S rRNA (uracil1498-N3)-methyltransferase